MADLSGPAHPTAESGIKRKRQVLSCFECKRRKLKCDHRTPACTRCTENGHPELCNYDNRSSAPGPESHMDQDLPVHGQPQGMMLQLQQPPSYQLHGTGFETFSPTVASGSHSRPGSISTFDPTLGLNESTQGGSPTLVTTVSGTESITSLADSIQSPLSDSSSKSLDGQFKGASHSMSILTFFQGIRGFLKKTLLEHPILGASKWAQQTLAPALPLPMYSKDEVEQVMKSLLPPEHRCRHFVHSYFSHFGGTLGVFHAPTFWQDYGLYWSGAYAEPARFTAVLLAAISCARCLHVDDPLSFDGDSSSGRAEAVHWLHAIETWQTSRAATDATTLEGFQLRCLVLLSKTINDVDPQQHYTASQTLMADAVSSGLHRDVRALGGEAESVYVRETRRRLWASIAELELARCIERGVPSMAANLYSDIGQPTNCNDRDYHVAAQQEPLAHPEARLTDASFLRLAHALRPLRHRISNLVNDPLSHRALSQAQLLAYRQQISSSFAAIPEWSAAVGPEAPGVAGGGCDLAFAFRTTLQTYLHELLLLLHLPFALVKDRSLQVDADYARFVCIKSASVLIKSYEQAPQHGFSQLALPRASLIRAGLCLCLVEMDTIGYGFATPAETQVSRNKLVEAALDMVEQRVLALGTGLQGFWLLSAASCYVESCKAPALAAAWQKRMPDHLIALFSKMCLTQTPRGDRSGGSASGSAGAGSSDVHLARYIAQIQQTSECVGGGFGSETSVLPSSTYGLADSLGVLESSSNDTTLMNTIDPFSWGKLRMEDWSFAGPFDA